MISYFGNIHKNIMGTTSFDLRIKGMRKNQDFIVYPMQKTSEADKIQIQSDNRFGFINLKTGEGKMSKPHGNHAGFLEYQIDQAGNKLTGFGLRQVDLQALRLFIFTTQSKMAGTSGIMFCDNSKASQVLS